MEAHAHADGTPGPAPGRKAVKAPLDWTEQLDEEHRPSGAQLRRCPPGNVCMNSMIKFFVLDVLPSGVVAVSADLAPDDA